MSGSRETSVRWQLEWTDALRGHLAAGLSASQAAIEVNAEFGTPYTRCAVIGKAKRAGIPLRAGKGGRFGPKGGPSQRKPRVRASTKTQRPDIAQRKAAAGPKLVAKPFIPRTVDVRTENVTLLELEPDSCRWPSGDGPFLFCNHRTDEWPYCGPHHNIAYRTREARR